MVDPEGAWSRLAVWGSGKRRKKEKTSLTWGFGGWFGGGLRGCGVGGWFGGGLRGCGVGGWFGGGLRGCGVGGWFGVV